MLVKAGRDRLDCVGPVAVLHPHRDASHVVFFAPHGVRGEGHGVRGVEEEGGRGVGARHADGEVGPARAVPVARHATWSRFWGSAFWFEGLKFRVEGLGFRV